MVEVAADELEEPVAVNRDHQVRKAVPHPKSRLPRHTPHPPQVRRHRILLQAGRGRAVRVARAVLAVQVARAARAERAARDQGLGRARLVRSRVSRGMYQS